MTIANHRAVAAAAGLFLLLTGCERTVEPLGPLGPFDAADGEFTTTESGLKYRITREGTGDKPTAADLVKVHYQGQLADGMEFDSSYQRHEPAQFPLGRVIPGWTEGMQLVAEEGMLDLIVPPKLGYGDRPPPGSPIPAGATLYFTIELLEVVKAPGSRGNPAEGGGPDDGQAMEDPEKPLGPFTGTEGEFSTTDSGLKYRVTQAGEGEKPTASDVVKVHYEGKLANGKVFDSSYKNNRPAEFPLNRVIPGWTEGMQLVGVGGKIDLVIPASLAYAESPPPGSGIHKNATLFFTVELLEIVEPAR